ncbi:MAG: zinc ABC transporter substrate-binding protein [Campylobacterota bacterium]|nr:zinc ABC transporter substrate-binding protein [Campylobacterota bacterium]
MPKVLFLAILLLSTITYAKPVIVVSILPEKTFVQKIAKDMFEVEVMVTPGSSPHSYEPKASQMRAISKAALYFSIGVEFEKAWIKRFQSQNSTLKFIDLSANIKKIEMVKHHHGDDHHDGNKLDPHTWTSPKNVLLMAETIYASLVKLDPKNKDYYNSNFTEFVKEIKETDAKIRSSLKNVLPKSKFMVFHPSWGYFANEYNLIQIAVEVEGKKPKPKELIEIINEAKEEKVRVIFTQPEFSDKSAKIIAKELDIGVVKISPLNPNWSANLINMAKNIAK